VRAAKGDDIAFQGSPVMGRLPLKVVQPIPQPKQLFLPVAVAGVGFRGQTLNQLTE
jgi:hypothetical protein